MPAIRLTWQEGAPDQAGHGFRIYRRVNQGPWVLYQTLPLSQTTFVDTDVAYGHVYAYRVVEYFGESESDPAEVRVALAPVLQEALAVADSFFRRGRTTQIALTLGLADRLEKRTFGSTTVLGMSLGLTDLLEARKVRTSASIGFLLGTAVPLGRRVRKPFQEGVPLGLVDNRAARRVRRAPQLMLSLSVARQRAARRAAAETVGLAVAAPRRLARAYARVLGVALQEFEYHKAKTGGFELLEFADIVEARALGRSVHDGVSLWMAARRGVSRAPLEEWTEVGADCRTHLTRFFLLAARCQDRLEPILTPILRRRLEALSVFRLEEVAEALQRVRFPLKRLIAEYYDAEGNIQSHLFHYDRGRPGIRAFLEPAALELERIGTALMALYDQCFLATAQGAALDAIGARWGVRRGEGQSDEEYRERIRLEIQICLSSGTTEQIKDIVCRWFRWPPGAVEINRNYSKLLRAKRDAFYEIMIPLDWLLGPVPKWFRFAQQEGVQVLHSEHGFDRGRFKYPHDWWNWRLVYELNQLLDRITAAGVEWLIYGYNGFRFSLDPLAPTEDSPRGFDRGRLVGGVWGHVEGII